MYVERNGEQFLCSLYAWTGDCVVCNQIKLRIEMLDSQISICLMELDGLERRAS